MTSGEYFEKSSFTYMKYIGKYLGAERVFNQ
jgi:hypothetical protein